MNNSGEKLIDRVIAVLETMGCACYETSAYRSGFADLVVFSPRNTFVFLLIVVEKGRPDKSVNAFYNWHGSYDRLLMVRSEDEAAKDILARLPDKEKLEAANRLEGSRWHQLSFE